MLAVAKGTVQIGWFIPSSATARILETGGAVAMAVLVAMAVGFVVGVVDVILNDVLQVAEHRRGPNWFHRASAWMMSARPLVCYWLGTCYLVQAYAGLNAGLGGIGFLLWYYVEVALIAGMLVWSLIYLEAADAGRESVS